MFNKYLVLSLFLIMNSSFAESVGYKLPGFGVWLEYSQQNGRSVELLYSMALVESGKYVSKDNFIPWPYAIGVGKDEAIGQYKHESLYPKTYEEAKQVLAELISLGHKNLGIGIMQVNIRENASLVKNPFDLLDPEKNIKVASKIIKQCNKNRTETEMLSCYSHGRYISAKGRIYALKVFDYIDRFASKFVNQYQPTGVLTLAELGYYMAKQTTLNTKYRGNRNKIVYIVE